MPRRDDEVEPGRRDLEQTVQERMRLACRHEMEIVDDQAHRHRGIEQFVGEHAAEIDGGRTVRHIEGITDQLAEAGRHVPNRFPQVGPEARERGIRRIRGQPRRVRLLAGPRGGDGRLAEPGRRDDEGQRASPVVDAGHQPRSGEDAGGELRPAQLAPPQAPRPGVRRRFRRVLSGRRAAWFAPPRLGRDHAGGSSETPRGQVSRFTAWYAICPANGPIRPIPPRHAGDTLALARNRNPCHGP